MRTRRSLAVMLALVASSVARADTIDVDSTTLLNVANQTRGGTPGQPFDLATTATAFEILSLTARDVRNGFADDLTFVLKTWAAYDMADRRWDAGTGSNLTGDVVSGYAQGKFFGRSLTLRLGRTMVSSGAARTLQLDGGEAVLLLPAGFRVSGYVGAPVTQRFATRSSFVSWNPVGGDLAAGGRLGWSLALPGAPGRGLDLGASVNTVQDHGDPVRQEVGADLRFVPVAPFVLSGLYTYSLYDARTSEATARASLAATRDLLLEADYQFVAPDLLLARNSILSVFSAEERQVFGGGATYAVNRTVKVGASVHAIIEPKDGGGTSTGSEADAKVEWARGNVATGLEGFWLDAIDNGYVGGRVFGRYDFAARAFAAADVMLHSFREKVNGQDYALTGSITGGYDLLRGLALVANFRAGVTPFMEQTFEGMVKLVYNQTYKKTEVR
jgi:hypothetical protein